MCNVYDCVLYPFVSVVNCTQTTQFSAHVLDCASFLLIIISSLGRINTR